MANPNKPTSQRRKFDKTFKAGALRMLDEGQTAPQVVKTINVSDQLLHTWKHAHKKQTQKQVGNSELIAENERLKAQLKRAEMEPDILKRCTAHPLLNSPNNLRSSQKPYFWPTFRTRLPAFTGT